MNRGPGRVLEPDLDEDEVRIERADRLPSLHGGAEPDPGWHRLSDRRTAPSPRVDRRDASLRRHGLVLLAALLGILLVAGIPGGVADPGAAADAVAVAELDRAVTAVTTGGIELSTTPREVADGVSGALVGANGQTPLLVAPGTDGCFAVVVTSAGSTIGRHYSRDWTCAPSSGLAAAINWGGDAGPAALPGDPYPWGRPSPTRWPAWSLLTMMLSAMVAVGASLRIVIILVTGEPFGEHLDLH